MVHIVFYYELDYWQRLLSLFEGWRSSRFLSVVMLFVFMSMERTGGCCLFLLVFFIFSGGLRFVLVVWFTTSRGCYPFFFFFFFRVFFISFCFQVVFGFVMEVLPASAVASLCEMSAMVVAWF